MYKRQDLRDSEKSVTIEFWTLRNSRYLHLHSYIMGFANPGPAIHTSRITEHSEPTIGAKAARDVFIDTSIEAGLSEPAHIALVRDGELREYRFYINGMVAGRCKSMARGKGGFRICGIERQFGGHNPAGGPRYSGWIDEVRISTTARYDKDFRPAQRFVADEETQALYHFDEGQGDVLIDSSGNDYHGKIIGADWVSVTGEKTKLNPQSSPAALARAATELVIKKKGAAVLLVDGQRIQINGLKDIPEGPFEFRGVRQNSSVTIRDSINDEDCRLLAQIPTIDQLLLSGSNVTTKGIREFASHEHLVSLEIPRRSEDSAAIIRLFPKLRYIWPAYSGTKDSTTAIRDHPSIVALNLYRTDKGGSQILADLVGHPTLRYLNLVKGALSSEEFEVLGEMTTLEHLVLQIDGNLKVAQLAPLANLKSLQSITLAYDNSRRRKEFDAAIAQLLPNCEVQNYHESYRKRLATIDSLINYSSKPVGVRESAGSIEIPHAIAPFDSNAARKFQQTWADHLGVELETTITYSNKLKLHMVLIPPGEFLMGSTDSEVEALTSGKNGPKGEKDTLDRIKKNERPCHRVRITRPFLMSKTEITVGQFAEFARATDYKTAAERESAKRTFREPGFKSKDDSPAAQISWGDANAFCKWLSKNGTTYRLPTEAEWEFSCRAGTETSYSFGESDHDLKNHAWYALNSKERTQPVATKLPNPFGLHDMHGSLQEWCQDFFKADWYSESNDTDPLGPATGAGHVLRGGHWGAAALDCRSAYRRDIKSRYKHSNYGFRIVQEIGSDSE